MLSQSFRFIRAIAVTIILLAASASAGAATTVALLTYTFDILGVSVDDGTSMFAGTSVGDSFNGSFTYGLSASEADFIAPSPSGTETVYAFQGYQSTLSNGAATLTTQDSFAFTGDDSELTSEEADFVNFLLGTTLVPGTAVDLWGVTANTSDAARDPILDTLIEGATIRFVLLSLNTSLFNNQDFRPALPSGFDVGAVVFEIASGGTTTFSAFGRIDLVPIPVPAAVWLMGSALGLLAMFRRKVGQK